MSLTIGAAGMSIAEVAELRKKAIEGSHRLEVSSWKVEKHVHRRSTLRLGSVTPETRAQLGLPSTLPDEPGFEPVSRALESLVPATAASGSAWL